MAEGLLRHFLKESGRNDFQVLSAGIGTPGGYGATPETIEVMKAEGIDVSGHIGQPVTHDLIHHADAIFCMEELHQDHILALAPDARPKVHLLKTFESKLKPADPNIPDPMGRPKEVYESSLMTIREAVERVTRWLEKQ